jgi:hypothetical protein
MIPTCPICQTQPGSWGRTPNNRTT